MLVVLLCSENIRRALFVTSKEVRSEVNTALYLYLDDFYASEIRN